MFICKHMNTDSEGGIRLIRSPTNAARLSHDVRLRSFIRMFTPIPMSMVLLPFLSMFYTPMLPLLVPQSKGIHDEANDGPHVPDPQLHQ